MYYEARQQHNNAYQRLLLCRDPFRFPDYIGGGGGGDGERISANHSPFFVPPRQQTMPTMAEQVEQGRNGRLLGWHICV